MANRTPEAGRVNGGGNVIAFPMHRVRPTREEDEQSNFVGRALLERMLDCIYEEMNCRAGGEQ